MRCPLPVVEVNIGVASLFPSKLKKYDWLANQVPIGSHHVNEDGQAQQSQRTSQLDWPQGAILLGYVVVRSQVALGWFRSRFQNGIALAWLNKAKTAQSTQAVKR